MILQRLRHWPSMQLSNEPLNSRSNRNYPVRPAILFCPSERSERWREAFERACRMSIQNITQNLLNMSNIEYRNKPFFRVDVSESNYPDMLEVAVYIADNGNFSDGTTKVIRAYGGLFKASPVETWQGVLKAILESEKV